MIGYEPIYTEVMKHFMEIDLWIKIAENAIKIIFILIAARLLLGMIRFSIDRIFDKKDAATFCISERRTESARDLVRHIAIYVIYFVVLFFQYQRWGNCWRDS
jgi:moderate conductance mechanosensitive channel